MDVLGILVEKPELIGNDVFFKIVTIDDVRQKFGNDSGQLNLFAGHNAIKNLEGVFEIRDTCSITAVNHVGAYSVYFSSHKSTTNDFILVNDVAEFSKKAHDVFVAMNWEWHDIGVPTVTDIYNCAMDMVVKVSTSKCLRCHTGRIVVTRPSSLSPIEFLIHI
jgi:hypothetical protein